MTSFKYTLFGALFLLASCGEQTELEQPTIGNGETVEVTKEISINVLPIQSVGSPATRSAANSKPEKGEAIGITYTDDAVTRVQTGSDAMTSGESAISNAYILQFEGTAPTSKLKVKQSISSSQLTGGSAITCNFTMTAGVKNRVYVVANCSKTLTVNNTTLADFESPVTFAPATSVSGGLPMSAMQDVGVGDVFDVFQLRSVLAKLKFTTSAGTLKLKGVPNGYSFFTQTPGDKAVRPTGTTYSNSGVTLASGTTYYVPENLSGHVQLSSPMVRCSKFAPASSMFVEIDNTAKYNIYLGDGSASDFNFVGGYAYNINATLYGTSEFDWRVGTPPSATALDSEGTANCYIASADKWYSFAGTVMGNGAVTPVPADLMAGTVASAIIPSTLNPASADVLWETQNTATAPVAGDIVKNIVHVANGVIYFKSGSTLGNAVIAARDASDTIIWSWHIWRTEGTPSAIALKDITNGSGFTVSGLQLMDRNLGALEATTAATDKSIGLYYQWGRKDPFPGAATLSSSGTDFAKATNVDFATDKSSSLASVASSVASPTTFYNMGSVDWCITRNDNLWGTALTGTVTINNGSENYTFNKNSGSKSIYDPCPVGWRVAPAYAFANANVPSTAFTKGWDFDGKLTTSGTSLFLSASGYRGFNSVALGNVGSFGCYWVASPNATNTASGAGMSFGSRNATPTTSSNNKRPLALGVRCSQ